MGWAGIENGELLALAEKQFEVFITGDRNLSFQQKIRQTGLSVVVLAGKSTQLKDTFPIMAKVAALLPGLHSFRYQFRDTLTEAGVPIPDVERLGGWEIIQRSAERLYGHGPSLRRLKDQIQKVSFPNLVLAHLHAP